MKGEVFAVTPASWLPLIETERQRIYQFLLYLAPSIALSEDSASERFLDLFKQLARRLSRHSLSHSSQSEERLLLYRVLWECITAPSEPIAGRWRDWEKSEQDLIALFEQEGEQFWKLHEAEWLRRIRRIDLEFRGPLVLRHLLNFDEEQCVTILSQRWEIFRYRLHLARIELMESLASKKEIKTRSAGQPSLFELRA